jgi:hypothetical protein
MDWLPPMNTPLLPLYDLIGGTKIACFSVLKLLALMKEKMKHFRLALENK